MNRPETMTIQQKKKKRGKIRVDDLQLFALSLPTTIWYLLFCYIPMFGILIAFKKYKVAPGKGFLWSLIHNSPWCGLDNFKFLFSSNMKTTIAMFRNTVGYNIVFMALGLVLSVGLAIIINELNNRIAAKVYHTILFLPYFISWIVVAYLVYAFVSAKGVFNQIFTSLGLPTINFYSEPKYWPFIFVFCNMWKYTGNNSIIYLATLSGFDQELYEAAAIDGAGKWQQIRHITLPQLVPTIVLLQILAVGRIFNGDFDMFYSLPNGSGPLKNVSTTLDVYVYNTMKTGAQLGLASAAAFFQSVVGFVLVLTTNLILRRVSPEMAMF